MSFIVPDEGELFILEQARIANIFDGKSLRLFQNNITPSPASVLGDFAIATFSGYASDSAGNFGTAATEVANKAQIVDDAARVFTHNGGGVANTIYGYYLVGSAGSKVMLAERFAAPVTMSTAGDNISILLTIKLNGV